jgi:hypothetical protein
MKKNLLLFVGTFLLCTTGLLGQNIRIYGVIKDSVNNTPVAYATVTVLNLQNKQVASGSMTDEEGKYEIEKLSADNYTMNISCLGYLQQTISITKESLSQKNVRIDALLNMDVRTLGEITVTADRTTIEFRPDKKIINIDPKIAASGASVADAIQSLPEVKVDGKNVTLKTYAPTILVNGRPAGPAMQNLTEIPASMIASVEVITNPSVKYNPEGIGGIINLKTKREPLGINGMIQGSGGTNNQYNAVGTLNYRTQKWNVFANAYDRYTGIKEDGYLNETYDAGYSVNQTQSTTQKINRISTRLGVDYYPDSMNVFTLYWEGSLRKGKMLMETGYNEEGVPQPASYLSNQQMKVGSNDNQIGMNYTHTFKNKTELTVDAIQSFMREPYKVDLFFDREMDDLMYNDDMHYKSNDNTVEIKYATPLFKTWMLEVGATSDITATRFNDKLSQYDGNSTSWQVPYDNVFELDRMLGSTYFTIGKQIKNFSVQVGLRGEFAEDKLYQQTARIRTNSHFNLFPSIGVNQQLGKGLNMTLNYSQRVKRPQLFNVSPYAIINYQYPSARSVGNPELESAYTHSIDLSIYQKRNKITWGIFASYMRTEDDIVNTYYSDNDVFYTTWDNVGRTQKFILNTSIDYHARFLGIYRPALALSMNEDMYDTPDAQGQNVHTNYFNYNVSLTNIFYLPKKFTAYFYVTYYPTTHYYASKTDDRWNLRFHIQKTFGTNLTAALSFYNILGSYTTTHSYGNGFTAKSFTNNHTQAVYLGVIYKFGKPIKTRAKVDLNLNKIEMQ